MDMAQEEVWRPFPPLLQAALDSIFPADYVVASRILKCFTIEIDQVETHSRFFPPASTFRKLITLMCKEHSSNSSALLFQVLVTLKDYLCSIPGYGWEKSPFTVDDHLESLLHPFHLMGFDSSHPSSLRPFAFLKALIQALKENHCELLELTQYFDFHAVDEEDINEDEYNVGYDEQLANDDKQSWRDGFCQILRYFLVVLEDPKAAKAFYSDASSSNRVSEGKTCIFRYCLPYLVTFLGNNDEKTASVILQLCLQFSKKFNKEWDISYIQELTRKILGFHQAGPWKLFLSEISDLQLRMIVIELVLRSESFFKCLEMRPLNIDTSQRYIPQLMEWMEHIEVKEDSNGDVCEELELLFLFIYHLLDAFVGLQSCLEELEANFSECSRPFLQTLFHLRHLWNEYKNPTENEHPSYCMQLEALSWLLHGVVLFNST